MGIAKLILGFDKSDLEDTHMRLDSLEQAVRRLQEALERLEGEVARLEAAIGGSVREIRSEQLQFVEALEERFAEIEDSLQELSRIVSSAQEGEEQDSIEEIVLEAIRSGKTTPTEIIETTGLPKNRVYSALRRLVESGVLYKQREGRHVHYYIAQDAVSAGESGEAVA